MLDNIAKGRGVRLVDGEARWHSSGMSRVSPLSLTQPTDAFQAGEKAAGKAVTRPRACGCLMRREPRFGGAQVNLIGP